MIHVRLQYFASLREQARCSEAIHQTAAADAAALYEELARHHGFSLLREQLRVAINGEFASWDRLLADNDVVVFLPPVAGG